MRDFTVFIKTYWTHVKSILDLVLFIVSVTALVLGLQVTLAPRIGLVIILITIFIALYRTWLYQYRQHKMLFESIEKEITYDDLSDIRKYILRGLSADGGNRVIPIGTLGGVVFSGIGDVSDKYGGDEILAELVELEKQGILRVDSYNKSGQPVYRPSSLGFKMLKSLANE